MYFSLFFQQYFSAKNNFIIFFIIYKITESERNKISEKTGGKDIKAIAKGLLNAFNQFI